MQVNSCDPERKNKTLEIFMPGTRLNHNLQPHEVPIGSYCERGIRMQLKNSYFLSFVAITTLIFYFILLPIYLFHFWPTCLRQPVKLHDLECAPRPQKSSKKFVILARPSQNSATGTLLFLIKKMADGRVVQTRV